MIVWAISACIIAVLVTPLAIQIFAGTRLAALNYRGQSLPMVGGLVLAVTTLTLVVIDGGLDRYLRALLFLAGVFTLGGADDLFSGARRGIRNHFAALRQLKISTGVAKALGILLLALWFLAGQFSGLLDYLVAVFLLTLTTNLFNFFDLRPGRCLKVYLILILVLLLFGISSDYREVVVISGCAVIGYGLYDLRAVAMLGDSGSNLLGAIAGLALVFSLSPTARLLALLAVLVLSIYGEFRSLGSLIERTPLLRTLDSVGRK